MKIHSNKFTTMLGHVEDGCIIIAPSGREFTLRNTMSGWVVVGPDGVDCSGNLKSARDVEFYIVNGLQSA